MFVEELTIGSRIIIVGVDPGLGATGAVVLALVDGRPELVFAETKTTAPKATAADRLADIATWFVGVLDTYKPNFVSVEEVFIHGRHPATAISMAQARGVVLAACGAARVKVLEYAPRRVKQAIAGTGSASKEQVQKMVRRHLGLADFPGDEHAADAAAVALSLAFEFEKYIET